MRFSALLFFTGLLALSMGSAAWASRPGTPNYEHAEVIGPTTIRVSWNDTAGSGATLFGHNFSSGGPSVIFEVEAGGPDVTGCVSSGRGFQAIATACPHDASSGYLRLSHYDADGRLHWDAGGLMIGRRHCFRIWSRNADDDMRSGQPSAFACADLPGQSPPVSGPLMHPQDVRPMRRQIVWLGSDNNGVMAEKTDGFLMAIPPGRNCPAPWRDVMYQNGGIPGLGGAHERFAADMYWLCWSALLPAPAPAPRVTR